MFKKIKQRVLSLVTPSSTNNLTQGAAQERRSEALTKFLQAALTILMGVWLAPLFYGQANLVIAIAGGVSVMFLIQGFQGLFSSNPFSRNKTTDASPKSAPKRAKTQKSPSPPRQDTKLPKSPTPAPKSTHADIAVSNIFSDLQQQGWTMKFNLLIPNLETVNVFLQSPNKNAFIVNFQSYQGEVFFDEGLLKRRDWKGVSNFEQDLLEQSTEQALAVKKMKRLRSVIPVLCFSDATLCIETVNNKARDVYIVKKEALVRKLLRLDRD